MELLSTYDKVQNACHHLNADAYRKFGVVKGQFTPCAKADFLIAAQRKEMHFGTMIAEATQVHCPCHGDLTVDGLYTLCFDDTAKRKYNGESMKYVAISHSGKVKIHLPYITEAYATLCGMDGDDPDRSVQQETVPVPHGAKVNCWKCHEIWLMAHRYKNTEFDFTGR